MSEQAAGQSIYCDADGGPAKQLRDPALDPALNPAANYCCGCCCWQWWRPSFSLWNKPDASEAARSSQATEMEMDRELETETETQREMEPMGAPTAPTTLAHAQSEPQAQSANPRVMPKLSSRSISLSAMPLPTVPELVRSRGEALDLDLGIDLDLDLELDLAQSTSGAGAEKKKTRPKHALAKSKARSHTSPQLYRAQSAFEIGRAPSVLKAIVYSNTVAANAQAQVAERKNVQVFLGGSCNPTTWRRDIAMPMLDAAHVSYFNPQVDDWYEALVYEESVAKESAVIFFAVIDNATRGIVSIHECIEHIFRGRRMVLVVQNFEEGVEVDGKVLDRAEIADLNGARACLRRLALKKRVPLFADVESAVNEVIVWLGRDNIQATTQSVPRLRKLSSIVLNEWMGQFHFKSKYMRSCSSSSILSVVSDAGDGAEESSGPRSPTRHMVCHAGVPSSRNGFVYLGGNLQATSWREQVAVPKLQQAGIPFYIPLIDYLSSELSRQSSVPAGSTADERQEVEAERDLAQLVLFVIPGRSRSISAMTEAVELIANHYALLLVIEPLEEGCELDDGTPLVGREYKDLARARVYLEEMAVRHSVEVFESVELAVDSMIERLHY